VDPPAVRRHQVALAAVAAAPAGALVVLMLHHHVLPLPADHVGEWIISCLGWPYADELERGIDVIEGLRGRCDLVLHGHRHNAAERLLWQEEARALRVVNAGSAPSMGRVRVMARSGGRVIGEHWLELDVGRAPRPAPAKQAGRAPARATV
jgi:hypothetical protein